MLYNAKNQAIINGAAKYLAENWDEFDDRYEVAEPYVYIDVGALRKTIKDCNLKAVIYRHDAANLEIAVFIPPQSAPDRSPTIMAGRIDPSKPISVRLPRFIGMAQEDMRT